MNTAKNRYQFARIAAALLFAASLIACTTARITGPFSPSGTLIEYYKAGTGFPTVVFESGLGNGRQTWDDVMPAVKRTNQVFAYNRPGYGLSRGVDGPRDPCTIAAEERNLLRTVGIMPPYILVGHSAGGLYQYVYAKLYPEDVAGVVLLDPTHPEYLQALQRVSPGSTLIPKAFLSVPLLSNGTKKREFNNMDDCLAQIDTTTPLHVPARVLVQEKLSSLTSGELRAMYLRFSADWGRLAGVQVERISSGHFIQNEHPQEVIAAIASVASMARGNRANQ